jgi:hypothetical protein
MLIPTEPVHESHIRVITCLDHSSLKFLKCFLISSSLEFKYVSSISLLVGIVTLSPTKNAEVIHKDNEA